MYLNWDSIKSHAGSVWVYAKNYFLYTSLLKQIPTHFYKAHTYPAFNLVRYKVVDHQDGLFTIYNDPGITLIGIDSQGHKQSIFARPRNKQWVLLSQDYSWDYNEISWYISTRYEQARNIHFPKNEKKDWYGLLDTYPHKFI